MIMGSLIKRYDSIEILALWNITYMIENHVYHHINPIVVSLSYEVPKVLFGPKVLINLVDVLRPVPMVAILSVLNEG